jgi:hypothetical protein
MQLNIIYAINCDHVKIFVTYYHCMCAAMPHVYILCSLQYAERLWTSEGSPEISGF